MAQRTKSLGQPNDVTDDDAIAALLSDLHWQIDQMPVRGIKDTAGNPYNPSYYKRGLASARARGGLAVADFVRGYLQKAPSAGYRKLEQADSLDLACEALVADDAKPYAHLFTDDERRKARDRLAPHLAAIERRHAASRQRIEDRRRELPDGLEDLRALAADATDPEHSIAVNREIVRLAADDAVALLRLGRAHEALGQFEEAQRAYARVLEVDRTNAIAQRRLDDVERALTRRGRPS